MNRNRGIPLRIPRLARSSRSSISNNRQLKRDAFDECVCVRVSRREEFTKKKIEKIISKIYK